MLERIVSKRKNLSKLAAAAITVLGLGCNSGSVPHYDVKYGTTDSSGYAHFEDNESGEFSIKVESRTGERDILSDAKVIFFDGVHSDAFYAEHPEYNSPDFQIFESVAVNNNTDDASGVNPYASLTVSPLEWQGWSLTQFDQGHDASRDFFDWATKEVDNGWGYHGCATYQDIEIGHNIGSVIYAGVSKLSPVAAVQSLSSSMVDIFEFFAGELETREASECEAFQWFGFVPTEWTTPTGAMVIPFCYEPTATEDNPNDGIDNDCDGEVDENDLPNLPGNNNNNNNNGGTESVTCSDLGDPRYLCDDFEDNSLSGIWQLESGRVTEEGGQLRLDSYSEIKSEIATGFTTDQFGIKLLAEVIPSEGNYQIVITNYNTGGINVSQTEDELQVWCNYSGGNRYSEYFPIELGNPYDLEISIYGGRTSVFVNDSILFGEDGCFANSDSSSLDILIISSQGDGLGLEYVSLDEF